MVEGVWWTGYFSSVFTIFSIIARLYLRVFSFTVIPVQKRVYFMSLLSLYCSSYLISLRLSTFITSVFLGLLASCFVSTNTQVCVFSFQSIFSNCLFWEKSLHGQNWLAFLWFLYSLIGWFYPIRIILWLLIVLMVHFVWLLLLSNSAESVRERRT